MAARLKKKEKRGKEEFNDDLSLSSFLHLNAALLLRTREVLISILNPETVNLKLTYFVVFTSLSIYVQRRHPKIGH